MGDKFVELYQDTKPTRIQQNKECKVEGVLLGKDKSPAKCNTSASSLCVKIDGKAYFSYSYSTNECTCCDAIMDEEEEHSTQDDIHVYQVNPLKFKFDQTDGAYFNGSCDEVMNGPDKIEEWGETKMEFLLTSSYTDENPKTFTLKVILEDDLIDEAGRCYFPVRPLPKR